MSTIIKASYRKKTNDSSDQLIVLKDSDKNKVVTNKKHSCLPYVHSHIFASALSAAKTQLYLLSESNNSLRFKKTMLDMDTYLADKFQVKRDEVDGLDKIDPRQLGSDQYKLHKLFADRKFLEDALHNTCVDMLANRCFDSLKATNMEIDGIDLYRDNLAEEENRNRIARREGDRHLRQQRNYIKTVLYDTNLTVDNLKCKVEDTELNSRIRSRYIENWEQARTEQHDHKIFVTESGPSGNIHYYNTRTDQEQRIHAEVELLVNITINETLTKVEQWMDKFDKDMEAQDLKIAKIKNKYKDAVDRRINLEETYATHETLMNNWVEFKEERRKAKAYFDLMTNSAIIVQAWWRGLQVRLQMGPYKPMKGTKKPQADKDKKKKK